MTNAVNRGNITVAQCQLPPGAPVTAQVNMMTRLDKLPVRVRGLARKVHAGRLVPADLDRVRKLPDSLLNRYEFLRVLAGGNPRVIGTLMDWLVWEGAKVSVPPWAA